MAHSTLRGAERSPLRDLFSKLTSSVHSLGREEAGTVFAEYVTLLVLISVGCVGATIALGVPLTNLFLFQRAILLLPVP